MRKFLRRAVQYVRHDLREIAFPRSLPNPPEYQTPRKLTWKDYRQAFRVGTKEYLDTHRAPKVPEKEADAGPVEPTIAEELAAAAKSAQGMKPVLLKIYQAQMNAYQLAIQNFILGYKEGVNQPVNLDAWLDASHADSLPQASPKESSQASPIQSQQMTQNSSVHSESPEASSGSTMQELPLNSTSYSREQAGQIVQSPGTVTEVDYMGMNEIEDWNSHILSQESQGSPVQSADRVHSKSRSIQSSGNGDTQSDTQIRIPDDMLEQFDGSAQSTLSGPVSSVEGVLERDVSNALAEAERLSAIMLSGKFTAEQRSQFQTAVSRAEALISDAKR